MFGDYKIKIRILFLLAATGFGGACEKVSPIGVLVTGSEVEDRVQMSVLYYQVHLKDQVQLKATGDYTFLIGSDSHLTTKPGRLDQMLDIGLKSDDLFYAHLGDIADTKAEYYVRLDSLLKEGKKKYLAVHGLGPDSRVVFPFFPIVGNHDVTRNGWALWSNIFHASYYEIDVQVTQGEKTVWDHLVFLDTASGTLGESQIHLMTEAIRNGKTADGGAYRYTFVFSHTNIFRPQFNEMASTFPREEQFFLLDSFSRWNVTAVFCGHVHTWDQRNYGGVEYITLEAMSEHNNPAPGKYLLRVKVPASTELPVEFERIHML